MADLQVKLAEAREQRARLEKLFAAADRSAEAARVLLAQESTYPRPRRAIESELHAAEMDCQWIQADLKPLATHERLLEAALGDEMARDLELAATAAARAVKTPKQRGRRPKPAQAATMENASADDSQKDPAVTGA